MKVWADRNTFWLLPLTCLNLFSWLIGARFGAENDCQYSSIISRIKGDTPDHYAWLTDLEKLRGGK